MGCDIHLHVEVKVSGNWFHYQHNLVPRNYKLFSLMAGVRGSETPIAQPRGFPIDASEVTRIDYNHWCEDAHTPSWLNANEIAALAASLDDESEQLGGYFFGNNYSDFAQYPEERVESVEDLRSVLWFDN